MKTYIGKLPQPEAAEFIQNNPSVMTGSLSNDGTRRLFSTATGEELFQLIDSLAAITGSIPATQRQQAAVKTEQACVHRGSQRFAECCSEKRVDQWICRKRLTDDGQRVDCVRTVAELSRAGSSNAVVACEGCELFEI